MRREGELTEESLIAAIADEVDRGGDPNVLAVGTLPLRLAALNILTLHDGLNRLVAGAAAVVLDPMIGDAWELRVDDRRTSTSDGVVPTR